MLYNSELMCPISSEGIIDGSIGSELIDIEV